MVLVYKDSVDIYYQHTKDEIAVSVLPGKKCLAMLSTTADYLLLKKKVKSLFSNNAILIVSTLVMKR